MNELNISDAAERLNAASLPLYASLTSNFYGNFILSHTKAYCLGGAILIGMPRFAGNGVWKREWSVCDTSVCYTGVCYTGVCYTGVCYTGVCDMPAAVSRVLELSVEDGGGACAYYIGEAPHEYISDENDVHFGAVGIDDPSGHSDVRALTAEDIVAVDAFASTEDDENSYWSDTSFCFFNDFRCLGSEENLYVLGIFDEDTLCGGLSLRRLNTSDVQLVCNLAVAPAYRRQGIASRLLRAALALNPGADYVYHARRGNEASAATARRAGFVVAGEYVQLADMKLD